ncbi:MAG: hypothetical protein U0172_02700 [Nitrospiraceae bacterium]
MNFPASAPTTKPFHEYVAIARRRAKPMLATFGVLALMAILVALMLPAVYRSTATILIEEQEVPQDLVRSTITTYADQRIETIKQHVLSRATLWNIVEQDDLYRNIRKNMPTESVIERFVKDIRVEVMNAKVVDKRTQNPTQATIAFTLSYDGATPEIAQRVANELTTLFLNENLKTRERHAQETTAFLKQEADNLSGHLESLESKIAAVKQRAGGALPELTQLNMQLMNQADRELMDLEGQIRSLEERKSYLEGELATVKPNTPIISASGERILDAGERLKALRAQYLSAAAYLSPEHPDVQKLTQEIEALERETGGTDAQEEIKKRLLAEQATLASLQEQFGADHPDVVRSAASVASLENALRRAPAASAARKTQRPENPVYIALQAQLASAVSSLNALKTTRTGIKGRVEEYARRLENTPQMEPEYLDLVRQRDTTSQKYQDIRSRLFEAQVSEGLEVQRKGERFSLVNPPEMPEQPHKPNRPLITLLGLMVATAAGLGVGIVLDGVDRSIRNADHLAQLTQAFPLAVIPYVRNREDQRRMTRRRHLAQSGVASGLLTLLLLCHFFWTPLDVLWFAALRRLGLN